MALRQLPRRCARVWQRYNTLPKLSSECPDLPITPFVLVAIVQLSPRGWGMKKILLASIAGAAALMTIAPANAADLGLRPMYAAPPAFTWSGCYIGGNLSAHGPFRSLCWDHPSAGP